MEELLETNHKFYSNEHSSKARYLIHDFSDIDGFEQDSIDPQYFAVADKGSNSYISEIKFALVTDNDDLTKLCREYINTSETVGSNWSFGLFDNLAEAKQWAESE
ncbi:MAG: hypothetical protein ACYSUT_09670 [Planctomycetota bacterium]|jgi:hypothetical protein